MSIYKPGRPVKFFPGRDKNEPPAFPGEYRIRSHEGDITYVGETNNLKRRAGEHIRSGKIEADGSFEYKPADRRSTSNTRREHERVKIEQHDPPLNRSKGGEGRPAK